MPLQQHQQQGWLAAGTINNRVPSALIDFYYCKIDPRSTTGSCGRRECTCSSLHISPGRWGEADGSPDLQREVDDVRPGKVRGECQALEWCLQSKAKQSQTDDVRTELVGFCSHGCSDVRRDLSDAGEGWEDGALLEVVLCGLIS